MTKGNKTYCLFSIYNEYNYYDEATKILHSTAYEMNTITAALSRGKFGLQSSRMTCARLTAKLCENYGLLHYEKDKTCIQANLKMLDGVPESQNLWFEKMVLHKFNTVFLDCKHFFG